MPSFVPECAEAGKDRLPGASRKDGMTAEQTNRNHHASDRRNRAGRKAVHPDKRRRYDSTRPFGFRRILASERCLIGHRQAVTTVEWEAYDGGIRSSPRWNALLTTPSSPACGREMGNSRRISRKLRALFLISIRFLCKTARTKPLKRCFSPPKIPVSSVFFAGRVRQIARFAPFCQHMSAFACFVVSKGESSRSHLHVSALPPFAPSDSFLSKNEAKIWSITGKTLSLHRFSKESI